jgi:hypothetical protein
MLAERSTDEVVDGRGRNLTRPIDTALAARTVSN